MNTKNVQLTLRNLCPRNYLAGQYIISENAYESLKYQGIWKTR